MYFAASFLFSTRQLEITEANVYLGLLLAVLRLCRSFILDSEGDLGKWHKVFGSLLLLDLVKQDLDLARLGFLKEYLCLEAERIPS